jgi:protein-tyrosine phosphatase
MIDIHHHLLPGLDDGATDMDTSVAMARLAVADGITHVVCTPHANDIYPFDPAFNRERLAALRARLAGEQIPLTLGLGCDLHLSYENIQAARTDPARFSINGGSYLLVELPDYGLSPYLTETFYELQLANLAPILTHPERNRTLQAGPTRMIPWLRGGLLLQVTADSVLGHMGKHAESLAHRLLADRWVHFLATDAHSARVRPPRMREAHALVAKKYGSGYADLICFRNPAAAFHGEPLPPQEEPLRLYDDMNPKSSWWRRFWNN